MRQRPIGRRRGGPRPARPASRRPAARAPRPRGSRASRRRRRRRTRRRARACASSRSRRAWRTSAGHTTASPAATRIRSSPTCVPAAALDDDEVRRVRVRVRLDPATEAERQLGDRRPRPSLWMTWPVTPRCRAARPDADGRPRTGGPRSAWPAPISGAGATGGRACPSGGSSPRPGELRLREVALLGESLLVRVEDRREPEEPDPGQRRRARSTAMTRTMIRSNEKTAAVTSRPKTRSAGPKQPLVEVEVRRVAMERLGPDVVEDDEADEQDERDDPRRREQVRESVRVERQEQVFPRRRAHVRSSLRDWSGVGGRFWPCAGLAPPRSRRRRYGRSMPR